MPCLPASRTSPRRSSIPLRPPAFAAMAAALAVAALAYAQAGAKPAGAPARAITVVNIEFEGSKVWVPGTLVFKKGEMARLTLVNNAPSGEHGFAIDEFGVAVTVKKGEPKTVEFKAAKTGLFRSYCQMHPAHVSGQVLVIQ